MRPIASSSVPLALGLAGFVEAHVAVADLQEGQARRFRSHRLIDQPERAGHAAGNRPEQAGARPGHAFQYLTAADAVSFIVMVVSAHDKLSLSP